MVPGEIGEHGYVEWNTKYALLLQCMRGNFHHRFGHSLAQAVCQQAIQLERFGRGVRSRKYFARNVILDCSYQSRLASCCAQDRLDQKCRGALSVGAGDSGVDDAVGGAVIEV